MTVYQHQVIRSEDLGLALDELDRMSKFGWELLTAYVFQEWGVGGKIVHHFVIRCDEARLERLPL